MAIVATLEESMSTRARAFLIVAVCHFTAIGATILIWPEMYSAAAWVSLIEYTTLAPWGWCHLAVAALCLVAVLTRWPNFARAGMVLAFVVLVITATGVGWGVVQSWVMWADGRLDRPASPFVPIACLALAVKDLLMVSAPLRTPFEDLGHVPGSGTEVSHDVGTRLPVAHRGGGGRVSGVRDPGREEGSSEGGRAEGHRSPDPEGQRRTQG